MDEEWKEIDWLDPIPKDKYSVSNLGRIRNNWTGHVLHLYKSRKGKWSTLLSSNGKIVKRMCNRYNLYIGNADKGDSKKEVIRRPNISTMVATAFVPVPKELEKYRDSLYVRPKDGDESNLVYTNLEWYDPYAEYRNKPKDDKPKRRLHRLPDDTVKEICMTLVEEDGALAPTLRRINKNHPEIKYDVIERIKYKVSYTRISDEYFEYYYGDFEPLK